MHLVEFTHEVQDVIVELQSLHVPVEELAYVPGSDEQSLIHVSLLVFK